MELLWFLTSLWLATTAIGAFTSMGDPYLKPYYAFACRAVLAGANLTCSMIMPGHTMTMPDCRASDDSFLTSTAYCIKTQCHHTPIGEIEQYWTAQITGDITMPPKWNYATTLEHVNGTPGMTWAKGITLNHTMLASPASWSVQNKFLGVMDHNGYLMAKYSIILLVLGFGTPIALTVLSKLPLVSKLVERLYPYLVYPATVGTSHVRPLPWLLGNVPTLGQSWYIAGFIVLNFILTGVGYRLIWPLKHPWGYDHRGEILAYAGYRTGEFAFALLPLTILFAGRNNILLWLTNWSHSTFILLHRWVARLFALHTILHSLFLWAASVQTGTYAADFKLPYWQWGIVGTVFVCAMPVFSMLWFRRRSYELFLISHIIMTIFTIVGSWYHLIYRFGKTGSHEYWLYAAFAVWAFDRLARVYLTVKNGVNRATVTEIGTNHVRVDIPNLRFSGKPGYHGYVYFPTINRLRPWENHPFSVTSSTLLRPHSTRLAATSSSELSEHENDGEKQETVVQSTRTHNDTPVSTAGITIYIRISTGLARSLYTQANVLTLLDGPYSHSMPEVLKTDCLLLLGGGVGITGLLSFLHTHSNLKLTWTVKAADEALAVDLHDALDGIADKEVRIGERVDVSNLLRTEADMGYRKVGVVACGPAEFSDEVRATVASLVRYSNTVFVLEIEAYSW